MRLVATLLQPCSVEFDLAALFARKRASGSDGEPVLLLGRQAKRCDIRVPVVAPSAAKTTELSEGEKAAAMNVSRVHAKLFWTKGGAIRIEDSGSLNGLFVNGLKVTTAELRAGDQLVIGYGAAVAVGGRLPAAPGASHCQHV